MKRYFRSQAGFPSKTFADRYCHICYPDIPKPKNCFNPSCPFINANGSSTPNVRIQPPQPPPPSNTCPIWGYSNKNNIFGRS